ncbi:SGNH hydrolase-type esterase domain-containing protein [Aspergillus spectabilis]
MVPWSSVMHSIALLVAGVFIGPATAAPSHLWPNNTTWHGSLEAKDVATAGAFELSGHSNAFSASIEPRAAGDFTLRILPLGASITQGYKSSDGNGYRKALRAQLRYAGWEVNMVGSVPSGSMYDKNHEGHPGYRIEQVANEAKKSVGFMPNVILINAGTNDATQQYFVNTTGERMDALLDYLYSSIPNTTIILSTLLPNTNQPGLVNDINLQYRTIYNRRRDEGDKIVLADMANNLEDSDLQDDTHPDDAGYRKMATVWWAAIQAADRRGFLTAPADVEIDESAITTCEKEYASGEDNYAQTQRGSGADDGNYKHSAKDMGRILNVGVAAGDIHDELHFAQLVNVWGAYREGSLDELAWTRESGETFMFLNMNNGEFDAAVEIDVKIDCVRWGDVNNDGLDDFICIGPDAAMYVAINRGAIDNVPMFEDIGLVRSAPGGDMAQINVKLGDIDGDGRLDYCLIAGNGDIQCWRNGGQREAPMSAYGGYWQDLGIVFTGKGMGDITGVRLVDINGDFRSDWLWLDETGQVTTYINNRGTGKGSLVPDWVSAGVTHAGMQVEGAKDRVKFGNVYPGNDNGADYVYIESAQLGPSTGADPLYNHYLHVWKNTGSGGTKLKGDGVFYCDMRGTGADDYVWVSSTGVGYLYGNIHSPPTWDPEGPKIFEAGVDRKALRLADFDGDGKCDLWLVDRATGTAEVWINKWDTASNTMSWDKRGVVTGDARCTEGWGVGLYDLGLRFHDINGDKRADYLCMEPDGRTTGALNLGENDFKDMGQIKRSEGYDRARDGLVDFLWVDKFNGDTWVWNNEGPMPDGSLVSGSTFRWTKLEGARYQGADRGANMHFPNLGGLGRADYHQVIPRTNQAYTWFNTCPGGSGPARDDQDASVNPQLPTNLAPRAWPTPRNFISYGDSYAAGIGASCGVGYGWVMDEWENAEGPNVCRRCVGSYPWQLLSAGAALQGTQLKYPSCSGAVTADLTDFERARYPQLRWIYEREYYIQSGWGTVSIGGNDLGFSDIAVSCLYWWNEEKCVKAMGDAAQKLRSPEFRLKLASIYSSILFDAMALRETNGQKGFLLIVTSYMKFFYDQDNACDKQYFWRGGYLKRDLRQNMNALVLELNEVIQGAIQDAMDGFGGMYNIIYFNADSLFEGHRFCQPGKDYRDSWFFVPMGADALADNTEVPVDVSQYPANEVIDLTTYWQTCAVTGEDLELDFACEYSKSLQNGGEDIGIGPLLAPAELAKALHPKTVAYKAMVDEMYRVLTNFR